MYEFLYLVPEEGFILQVDSTIGVFKLNNESFSKMVKVVPSDIPMRYLNITSALYGFRVKNLHLGPPY